ncbi:beta-ketoacyl synthase N-terminal-like domain-containing protein [Spirosoma validum]|uniref:Ketosynthase family 3 (KS3) domain-containing protein n=1 Tax=Spirosoma validum TaxID=2771355 RepID=A0A927GDY6_9BACT|nr:beta-ketoacyl synthase N-terminal-like domain-containing protein [Spirosoma validum]MBD2754061.1 hypothetical protein [Spirosoma validum]
MSANQTIVLTGGGILSSLGNGVETFWQNLLADQAGVGIREDWTIPEIGTQYFGTCQPFTFTEAFSKLKPPFPLKYSQLAMMACHLAFQHAGLSMDELTPERVGLLLDTSFGANAAAEEFLIKLFQAGPAKVSPFTFTKTTVNCALGDVARTFGIKGPSSMSLGENSVCYGYDLLQDGKADVVVCGGFDEVREITLWSYAERKYLLSPKSDGQPVDLPNNTSTDNEVMVMGEASAFVVLETLEHAKARGATIYAELVDYHAQNDRDYREFMHTRSEDDLTSTMNGVLRRSNTSPSSVGLVVGGACLPQHLSGAEGNAIRRIWPTDDLYYTTLKGRIGETFSASGIASLLTAALALRDKVVPGTGYASTEPTDGLRIPETTTTYESEKDYALVNSWHASGNNVSLLLKRAA